MNTLRVAIAIGLLSSVARGSCELSLRDQVGVIQKGEPSYSAPIDALPSMLGAKVQCAVLGPLTIVRPAGVKFYFVLDARRAFYRWEQTGSYHVGDELDAVRVYLSTLHDYDSWALWNRYALPPSESVELPSLPEVASLTWQSIQLIDRGKYQAALSANLKPEQVQFLHQAASEQVRLYMFDNDYKDSVILEERYGPVGTYSSEMAVTLRIKRGRRMEALELYLPINPEMTPFVGHVELTGIPPIRRGSSPKRQR